MWDILGIIAILTLIVSFFIGKNAIWGALTLAILICVVTIIVNLIQGLILNWSLYRKIGTVVILIGALFELVGRFAKRK